MGPVGQNNWVTTGNLKEPGLNLKSLGCIKVRSMVIIKEQLNSLIKGLNTYK